MGARGAVTAGLVLALGCGGASHLPAPAAEPAGSTDELPPSSPTPDDDVLTFGGPSMEPAIASGGTFRVVDGVPVVGDIVLFVSPADGVTLAKRVVAVGPATVILRDDHLWVDGAELTTTPTPCPAAYAATEVCAIESSGARSWTTMRDPTTVPESGGPYDVPAGSVFVLGDHRDRSMDSRMPTLGAIPLGSVLGLVIP